MTREEAIEYITSVREFYRTMEKFAETKDEAKFGIALDMAIEALQREEAEAKGYCHRIKPKELQSRPDADLISRADAIKGIRKCKFESDMPSDWYKGMEEAQSIIKALPSADAVHGEWIMHIDDLFPEESTQECSNCHEHETIKIRSDNFCPNCGAKMTKGGDTA